MEMVLELRYVKKVQLSKYGFNPSSNGNGAGIGPLAIFVIGIKLFQSFF